MHVFDMQIAIHVLHASSATGTRCSVMSCTQIYINAIRIERALSLQIIISFHRNGTFTFFAHMFRCVLRPLLVLTTVFLSTVIFERTLHNLSIALSLSLHLFLWPNLRKIWRQYRSVLASIITCIWHKMKKAATWTDAQAAQRRRWCKQVAFLPAFLIFHPQMLLVGSSVARMLVERGRSRKRSHQLLCPTSYLERVYKKEPLNVHYPPSTLGEAIRKLSFCRR